MSPKKLEKLTPEQEALIPVYRDKWRKIAYSTEPIDKQKAAEAVRNAYAGIGEQVSEILFFVSHDIAFRSDRKSLPFKPERRSCTLGLII